MKSSCSRPPVPFLGRQRNDGAALNLFLQQVNELFVRATIERLQQKDSGSLRGVLIILIRRNDQGGFSIPPCCLTVWFHISELVVIHVRITDVFIDNLLLCNTGLMKQLRHVHHQLFDLSKINQKKIIRNKSNLCLQQENKI